MSRLKVSFSSFERQDILLGLFLLLSAVVISFLVAKIGILVGFLVVFLVGATLYTIVSFKDYRYAFLGGFILSAILFYFERIISVSVPYGVICDLLFILAFASVLLSKQSAGWRSYASHPITLIYLFIFLYQIAQVFNINAVSIAGWALSLRALIFPIILFLAFILVQNQFSLKLFVKIWLGIAFAAALYGIYQEKFDLTSFEYQWVTEDQTRFSLIFIGGHMRKFSFLSDPASFGVFMAYSALACVCLIFSPVSYLKKAFLALAGGTMFLSMLYSGTRTAFAMFVIGIVFFMLISIRNKAVFVVAILLVLGVLAIVFGPFYGREARRLRSAFKPANDASMEVRDMKRVQWQAYIQDHPFGGGLNTTGSAGVKYSSGHELAGGWDADSGYLKVALEQGWIGLIILFIFLFTTMVYGINNHFKLSKEPMLQSINLSFLVPFFAATVGNFTQHTFLFKPIYVVIIVSYAVFASLKVRQTLNEK